MDEDELLGVAAVDNIVNDFETYETFLDSQITSLDLYYLEDEELARQLVELGYRGSGEVLKREEFEMRKAAAEAARLAKKSQKKVLASAGKELKDNFLIALAEREEDNRSGKTSSILFIRDYNAHGQEISGYIDYSHRLRLEHFEGYFSGKKKLLPRSTDLSFYNWDTQNSTSNSSPYYHVITDNASGLLFKNKRDRKVINVDPKASPGDNTTRSLIETELYVQVVIYDHITRRKT
ncbi:cilia- and flagella-associated protein 299 [Leucoraja erinacea]|uniref:cilia- and flagella-associated protein 299 n=1 Tax=Leucoraja erinaceus TaxID=7782 RepID=UPI0024548EA4|nr:cilia- and flagella-associated protein 299 [Leucoraja erinacea]